MTSTVMQQYQQPLWGRMEPALRNCFIGAGILGLVILIIVLVVPIPVLKPVTVTEVPERIARLILQKPETRIAKGKPGGGGGGGGVTESSRPGSQKPEPAAPPEVTTPKQSPMPRTPGAPPARRVDLPREAANRGVEGRTRATREVTQNLANVTGSLDKVLNNISTQIPAAKKSSSSAASNLKALNVAGLPSTDGGMPSRSRRGVHAGRSSTQIAAVSGVTGLSSADMSGSAIGGEGVSIGMITDVAGGAGGGAGLGGTGNGTGGGSGGGQGGGYGTGYGNGVGTGAGGGVGDGVGSGRGGAGAQASGSAYRSNESLLAVVRRYAAGIQFCYDNELRKKPGLRGKLVVSMVVLANGSVSEATIVEDTLNSPAVRDCALAQIRGWQFPSISSGVTSFKTPFVFTPPSQ